MATDGRYIDRRDLLESLKRDATSDEPGNILLAGPWGAGKTTLLNDLRKRIASRPDDNEPYVIWFSPWSTVADGDPRMAFLRQLRETLAYLSRSAPQSAVRDDTSKRVSRLLKVFGEILDSQSVQAGLMLALPAVGVLAPVFGGMAKLGEALAKNAQDDRTGTDTDKSPIQQMRNGVKQLLEDIALLATPSRKRVLLLVDDLDRARPEEAVAVLDSLYHLFMPHVDEEEKWPLTSVWAVNTAVLEEYLYREYRELPSFDPNAYLEKLFAQRINVPPLIKGEKHSDTARLWEAALENISGIVTSPERRSTLASELSEQVNYAILGNLRLHARVRRDCIRLWGTRPPDSTRDFVRDARLIVLVDAFSYFREQIAPFNGMWPHFVNQVNRRLTKRPMEWIANPLYRHVDSPDLATLLVDLGALQFIHDPMHYEIEQGNRARLQCDLNTLWKHGI